VDSRPAKIRRASFGALYGVLGGMAFVLMAAFIDLGLHPDLPLGVNWNALWLRLPLIGLGLGLVGVVTCWWHEAWQGLIGGAFVASALALITALFSSQVGAGLKFIVLVFILIPVAAMTLPIAYFLRWLTERHAQALHQNWRMVRLAGLAALMIGAGVGLGYFMKASGRAVEATRFVHTYLQDLTTDKNPLAEVAGVPERDGQPYTLYSTTSFDSTEGFDIHITYADGYRLRCAVILYPGRTPYLKACSPGE
jgi:hypothetical protein